MTADTITCTECSGTAHRVGYPPPDEDFTAGDVVAYLCEDCGHRMDVVVEDDEDNEHQP
ncbi:MAG TPA: hypothetical protein VJA44_04700 [Acidimicrobiia bacterium]|nr:hypothetical protein [Acidimicrobiia bacterium]